MAFFKALHGFLNSNVMRYAGTLSAGLAGYVAATAPSGSNQQLLATALTTALGALGLSAKPGEVKTDGK